MILKRGLFSQNIVDFHESKLFKKIFQTGWFSFSVKGVIRIPWPTWLGLWKLYVKKCNKEIWDCEEYVLTPSLVWGKDFQGL
jgi:hypothetical protein